MTKTKYTAAQILAMCNAPWQWDEQLRAAAKQHKLAVTSVTSIVVVVAKLREAVS